MRELDLGEGSTREELGRIGCPSPSPSPPLPADIFGFCNQVEACMHWFPVYVCCPLVVLGYSIE